jgi:hypothetical protein
MPAAHAKNEICRPLRGLSFFALFALGLTPQAKNLSRLRRFSSSRFFDEAAVNSQMSTYRRTRPNLESRISNLASDIWDLASNSW